MNPIVLLWSIACIIAIPLEYCILLVLLSSIPFSEQLKSGLNLYINPGCLFNQFIVHVFYVPLRWMTNHKTHFPCRRLLSFLDSIQSLFVLGFLPLIFFILSLWNSKTDCVFIFYLRKIKHHTDRLINTRSPWSTSLT